MLTCGDVRVPAVIKGNKSLLPWIATKIVLSGLQRENGGFKLPRCVHLQSPANTECPQCTHHRNPCWHVGAQGSPPYHPHAAAFSSQPAGRQHLMHIPRQCLVSMCTHSLITQHAEAVRDSRIPYSCTCTVKSCITKPLDDGHDHGLLWPLRLIA